MEEDTWSFGFSASSRHYQTTIKSQSDSKNSGIWYVMRKEFCFESEEIEVDDDDMDVDYPCPFCSEDYNLVELCFHIEDEHPLEANHGICPVCASRVRMNMLEHITSFHGNILKGEQKQKLCKDGSYSLFSSRKDACFQSSHDDLWPMDSSSKRAPDSFMSFVLFSPSAAPANTPQVTSPFEVSLEDKSSDKETSETEVGLSRLTDAEQTEKFKRAEFVQGLLMSTIFNDDS